MSRRRRSSATHCSRYCPASIRPKARCSISARSSSPRCMSRCLPRSVSKATSKAALRGGWCPTCSNRACSRSRIPCPGCRTESASSCRRDSSISKERWRRPTSTAAAQLLSTATARTARWRMWCRRPKAWWHRRLPRADRTSHAHAQPDRACLAPRAHQRVRLPACRHHSSVDISCNGGRHHAGHGRHGAADEHLAVDAGPGRADVFHVAGDDDSHDAAERVAGHPAVRHDCAPRRCRHGRCACHFRARLSGRLGRLQPGGAACAVSAGMDATAVADDGSGKRRAFRRAADRRRPLSAHAFEASLPQLVSLSSRIPEYALAARKARRISDGRAGWRVLRRLLLGVGGLMNLLWIAGLALCILIEKLAPGGLWLGRMLGVALMAGGGAVLMRVLDVFSFLFVVGLAARSLVLLCL